MCVESVGPRRAGEGCGDVGVSGHERGVSLSSTLLPSFLGEAPGDRSWLLGNKYNLREREN